VKNLPWASRAKENVVGLWDNLPVIVALLLASAAALTSSDTQARQQVASFVAEALRPQAGDDPGPMSGKSTEAVWRLPRPRASMILETGKD
jgi:hypothetical protein